MENIESFDDVEKDLNNFFDELQAEEDKKKRIQESKEKARDLKVNGLDDDITDYMKFYNDTAKRKTSLSLELALSNMVRDGSISEANIGMNDKFIVSGKEFGKVIDEDKKYTTYLIPENISSIEGIEDLPSFLENKLLGKEQIKTSEIINIPIVDTEFADDMKKMFNVEIPAMDSSIIDDIEDTEYDKIKELMDLMYSEIKEVSIEEEELEELEELEEQCLTPKKKSIKVKTVKDSEEEEEEIKFSEKELEIMSQKITKKVDKNISKFINHNPEALKQKDISENIFFKNEILNVLKGRDGRTSSESPSKKLNKRKIASGLSRKIFDKNDPIDGKKIKINLFVDMSGSMSGVYIKDSARIIDIFSILAKEGVAEGSVMYSVDGNFHKKNLLDYEENEPYIWTNTYGGDEDIEKSLRKYEEDVMLADINIALTDGQLCGEPIAKKYWMNKGARSCNHRCI